MGSVCSTIDNVINSCQIIRCTHEGSFGCVTPWPMNNVTVKLNTISVYFFFTYFINF